MRIRNYPKNSRLTDKDMLLGTDSNGLTKNFSLGDISYFITSGISLSGTTIITSADSSQISATRIGYGTITNDEFAYLEGVSANIQSQISTLKETSYHTHPNKFLLDSINQQLSTSSTPNFNSVSATTISANSFYNNNLSGSLVLVSDSKQIVESSITSDELNFINNLSANAQNQLMILSAIKANTTTIVSAGPGLSGGGNLSDDITFSLSTIGTPGSYNVIVTNTYGQVTSGRNLLSGDIPQLPATKIGSGNINNTEFEYLNGVSADIQTQLTNLSATKTDKTTTITAGTGLTGGGNLTTNRTISLATTGTAGTYGLVVTNAYGQVTSGRAMTSGDIPQLPATKIQTDISNRFVTESQINYWNSLSAGVVVSATSASQLEFDLMLLAETQKNNFILISATSSVSSASPNDNIRSKQFSLIYSGRREKKYSVVGPTSGTYSATVIFYGTDISKSDWVYPDNCVMMSIDNNTNIIESFLENNFVVWSASLEVSGAPSGYIIASVEV